MWEFYKKGSGLNRGNKYGKRPDKNQYGKYSIGK
jgi:hypothetical protein